MRTTLTVDDALLGELRQIAARTGKSLTAVIDDALRLALSSRPAPSHERVRLTTFRGDGLQPGVDLDDSASLLELMDHRATD